MVESVNACCLLTSRHSGRAHDADTKRGLPRVEAAVGTQLHLERARRVLEVVDALDCRHGERESLGRGPQKKIA